jgi:hypothetical protein
MLTTDLVRNLRDVDWLIAALSPAGSVDEEDIDDVRWLIARRKSLADMLTIRRALNGRKIVSLAAWRHGVTAPLARSHAAMAVRSGRQGDLHENSVLHSCREGLALR